MRLVLAQERHEPPRTNDEVARLSAQLFLTEASLQAEQKTAADFAATKHLRRWAVTLKAAGQEALSKTSLAATERALKREAEQAKFLGERRLHWDAQRREAARLRSAELMAQRAEIQQQIKAREVEYAERLERQTHLVETLATIHAREAERFAATSQPLPAARFTEAEWRTLEALAERRGEPDF